MQRAPTKHLRLLREADGYYRTAWHDETGKRHRRSFGRVRAIAENQFAIFRAEWTANPETRRPDLLPLSLADLWASFKLHADGYYRRADGSPSGEAFNLEVSFTHALETFGPLLAKDFGPATLRAIRDQMIAGGRLSTTTINARIRRIRHVFKWATAREMISGGVWHALQALEPLAPGRSAAKTPKPVAPVPAVDYQATLKMLPPTLRAMVEVQYWTGARPGEVCRMRAIDVDFSGKVWMYRPPQHKSAHRGRTRSIMLGPRAQAVIAPFLDRPTHGYLFTPIDAITQRYEVAKAANVHGAGLRLPSRIHPRWTVQAYAHAVRKACVIAGVEAWSPNRLRHSAATRLRASHGLDVAQLVLGHASADTTEIYAEADREKAINAIENAG